MVLDGARGKISFHQLNQNTGHCIKVWKPETGRIALSFEPAAPWQ